MIVCNYCGRNLKNHYDACPGCGATSFKEKNGTFEKYVIKTPPKDGYKVDLTNYDRAVKFMNIFKWFGIGFMIFDLISVLPFLVIGPFIGIASGDWGFGIMWTIFSLAFSIPFIGVGILFIVISNNNKKKSQEEMERITKLSKEGLLIKNMPYDLVNSGVSVNDVPVKAIKLVYEDGYGHKFPLVSNPKYKIQKYASLETADLLIDPNDISNYFIDFEIY